MHQPPEFTPRTPAAPDTHARGVHEHEVHPPGVRSFDFVGRNGEWIGTWTVRAERVTAGAEDRLQAALDFYDPPAADSPPSPLRLVS